MPDKTSDILAEVLVEREKQLRQQKDVWNAVWQEIGRLCIPREASFNEEVSPGVERTRYILDSTAPRALELFASFLHTFLNNPSSQWFIQRVVNLEGDQNLNDDASVKKYLERKQQVMLTYMTAHGMHPFLHESYLSLGAFGTGPGMVDDPQGVLRFTRLHLDDIVIDENEAGFVDLVFRQVNMSPRRAEQRWGNLDKLGRRFSTATGIDRHKPMAVGHYVFPLSDEDLAEHLPEADREKPGAAFASVWVNVEDRITISTGTYDEFPYMIPRWYKSRGEMWGRSPAMTVLPDIRMANRMKATILRGAEKLVDPPFILPDGALVSPLRLFSGGVSFSEGSVKPEPLVPPGASRIELGIELLRDTQTAIREGFFVPLFITPDSPVKTATQVLQEVDERNRATAPMIVRNQWEQQSPMLYRVHQILERQGRFPDAPDILAGRQIDMEFISPLMASQRQVEALGVMRLIEGLAPWTQMDPGILDPFDPDKVAEVVHAGSGAPAAIFRSPSEVRKIRDAREQQAKAQEEISRGFEGAKALAPLLKAAQGGAGEGRI